MDNIIVIGAGIIGTVIAERLLHEGHTDIILLDKVQPGEGCSKGNAGHFGTDIVLPLANINTILSVPQLLMDPLGPLSIRWTYFPKLLPWFMRFIWSAMPHKAHATSSALSALNKPSIKGFSDLLERTDLEYLMVKKGALTVFESDKSLLKFKKTIKILRQYGVELQELSSEQVCELEPAVNSNIRGGIFFPNTAHTINPYMLVKSLADKFIEKGGKYIQSELKRIEPKADGTIMLETDSGNMSAKTIIIAAGAWSKPLVKMTGYSVPLETERGYNLMLPDSEISLTRPVTSHERSFVMTPMEEGLRLAGTVEFGGLKAEMNNRRSDILYEHAINILPGINKSNATRWMGFRPSLPDSLPVIDQSPSNENIFYAFGHQHLGLTQAAVTADLMANLVVGRDNHIDMTPFKVDRF